MTEKRMSWAYRVEWAGPLIVALLFSIWNMVYFTFPLTNVPWRDRLMDRVIVAASVLVAYWGTAETILIALDANRVMERLRKLGYATQLVKYLAEALISCFLLLVVSTAFEPLEGRSDRLLSSVWIGLAVWSVLSSIRSFRVLTRLLIQAGRQTTP